MTLVRSLFLVLAFTFAAGTVAKAADPAPADAPADAPKKEKKAKKKKAPKADDAKAPEEKK
jgi:hypothetical protein